MGAGVDDAVVLPQQFFARVAAQCAEGVVHVRNLSASIRNGYQRIGLQRGKQGLILAHEFDEPLFTLRNLGDVVHHHVKSLHFAAHRVRDVMGQRMTGLPRMGIRDDQIERRRFAAQHRRALRSVGLE